MDFQNPSAAVSVKPQMTIAPAPVVGPDGRAVADVAASKKDATPEIPLPAPPSPSQTGLVSQAALKNTDAAPKLDASGTSAAERTLKPYGINMLPESQDTAKDNPDTAEEVA